jgi:hypothetical protein
VSLAATAYDLPGAQEGAVQDDQESAAGRAVGSPVRRRGRADTGGGGQGVQLRKRRQKKVSDP